MSFAYNGQQGTVTVAAGSGDTFPASGDGGTDMDVDKWTADIEVNAIETTTTADGGWHDEIGGTKKVTGTFEFFHNPSKQPFGTSIGLTPGAYVGLTLQTRPGQVLTGGALITKLAVSSQVNGATKVVASYTNKGPWILPS